MATFFDTTSDDDLDLLHESVRSHDELDNVVDKVEWEILNFYKQREGEAWTTYSDFFQYEDGADPLNEILVRLVGYDQDTPEDSEADLKEVLKYTIADVVTWVLRNYDNPQGVSSIQQGKRSIDYRGTVPDVKDWYNGWNNKLKNFDARISNYGI